MAHAGWRALSGHGDNTVRLWDLGTGKTIHTLEGHTSAVYGVALSADGTRVKKNPILFRPKAEQYAVCYRRRQPLPGKHYRGRRGLAFGYHRPKASGSKDRRSETGEDSGSARRSTRSTGAEPIPFFFFFGVFVTVVTAGLLRGFRPANYLTLNEHPHL